MDRRSSVVAADRPRPKETMMRRTLAAVGLLLVVVLTGCSGQDDDPSVATANPGATKAPAGAAATGQASQLNFSKCMREQGLSWFPDPKADGELQVRVPDGADEKFKKASEACKALEPNSSGNDADGAADLEKVRQVAKCLREHGFTKYPDPDANGHTRITAEAGVDPNDPAFQKAKQECQKYGPKKSSGGNS
jgi:hypothetical protein